MTDTTLIVRKVTAGRGVKAVTTHEVLACIKEMTGKTFSTRELADALMLRHRDIDYGRLEYSVRQSIVWLMRRGYVRRTERDVKRFTKSHEPYSATVYQAVEKGGPCDVCLLNQIFLRVTV